MFVFQLGSQIMYFSFVTDFHVVLVCFSIQEHVTLPVKL